MEIGLKRVFSTCTSRFCVNDVPSLLKNQQIRYKSVKAAVLKEFGSALEISEIKLPKLKKDEVRVRVKYCAVNQSDHQILTGQHEFRPKLPFVPGYEVAGDIVEVGSVDSSFKVGDKVIGLNKESCGGFAEMCNLPIQDCFQAPSGISAKIGSALLDGYTTALLGLARRGRVEKNDIVMVTAAGGGVGLAAVDLAANVYHAQVIAVCSTEDKAALVREKGAFAALKYSENLEKEIRKITNGKGIGLVFDATGGVVLENAIKCVSNEGRLVLASNAARNTENVSPSLLLPRSISLTGISLWHYRKHLPEVYKSTIEDAIDMAEQELIIPHISKVFELGKVNEALKYLMDAKCTGKVVLEIDD